MDTDASLLEYSHVRRPAIPSVQIDYLNSAYDLFYLRVGPSEATETAILVHFLTSGIIGLSVPMVIGDSLSDRGANLPTLAWGIATLLALLLVFLVVALAGLAAFLTALIVLAIGLIGVPLVLRYRAGMRSGGVPAFVGGIPVIIFLLLLAGFGLGWGWGYVMTAQEVPASSVNGRLWRTSMMCPIGLICWLPTVRRLPMAAVSATCTSEGTNKRRKRPGSWPSTVSAAPTRTPQLGRRRHSSPSTTGCTTGSPTHHTGTKPICSPLGSMVSPVGDLLRLLDLRPLFSRPDGTYADFGRSCVLNIEDKPIVGRVQIINLNRWYSRMANAAVFQ